MALLFLGLGENSRTWRKLNKVRVPISIQLQAMMVDCLSLLVWQNSADGQKGKNRPKLITPTLIGKGEKENGNIQTFNTPEDFQRERERRLKQWQQN